jgi:hypothetical protein
VFGHECPFSPSKEFFPLEKTGKCLCITIEAFSVRPVVIKKKKKERRRGRTILSTIFRLCCLSRDYL